VWTDGCVTLYACIRQIFSSNFGHVTIQGLGGVLSSASTHVFENPLNQAKFCPFQILSQSHFMKRPTIKNAVFWDVAPCRYFVNRRFGGTYRLHLQGKKYPPAMNQRELYTAPHPEDGILHSHRRENLKSYVLPSFRVNIISETFPSDNKPRNN
jgi:hypothetical protein